MVDEAQYAELVARKLIMPKTKFGDAFEPRHVESINALS